MSMNLKAVATLDAKPYIASLEKLAAATAKLQGTVAGAGKSASKGMSAIAAEADKDTDSISKQLAMREALAKKHVETNRVSQKASRASRRAMDEATQGLKLYGKELAKLEKAEARFNKLGAAHGRAEFRLGQQAFKTKHAKLKYFDVKDQGIEGPVLEEAYKRYNKELGKYGQLATQARMQKIAFPSSIAKLTKELDANTEAYKRNGRAAEDRIRAYKGMSSREIEKRLAYEDLAHKRNNLQLAEMSGSTALQSAARTDLLKSQFRVTKIEERERNEALKQMREQEKASRKARDEATQGLKLYGKELKKLNELEAKLNKSSRSYDKADFRLAQQAINTKAAHVKFLDVRDQGIGGAELEDAYKRYNKELGKYGQLVSQARKESIKFPPALASITKELNDTTEAYNRNGKAAEKRINAYKSASSQQLEKQLVNQRVANARDSVRHAEKHGTPQKQAAANRDLIKAQIARNKFTEREAKEAVKQEKDKERAQRQLINANKAAHRERIGEMASKRYLYGDLARNLGLAGAAGLAAPIGAMITNARWEKDYANVIRTADPSFRNDPRAIGALRESLTGMAKEMPIKFRDIASVATLGNQLGVATSDIYDFTRATDMFSTTTGVSVENTATAFGRLRTITGDVGTSYMQMSDAIAKVGVNSVATEEEIIKNITQTSSIAGAVGFSTREMIGLAGAMASVRIPPELARSTLNRTFGQLTKSVNEGGEALNRFSELSGYTQEELKQKWGGPESAQIFQGLLDGIRKAGGDAPEMLKSLGITSVRDVPALMRLASAADAAGQSGQLLRQTMNDAHNSAGETMEQYAIMADTVSGRFQVMLNNIGAFFDALGQNSQGFIKSAIDGIGGLFDGLSKVVNNPVANGIGWAAALTGGASLAAGAIAKVASGIYGMKQYLASRGAAKGIGGLLSGDFKQSKKRKKNFGFDPADLMMAGMFTSDVIDAAMGNKRSKGKAGKGNLDGLAPLAAAMYGTQQATQGGVFRKGGQQVDDVSKRTRFLSRDTGSATGSWKQLGRAVGMTAPFRKAEQAMYGTEEATRRLMKRQLEYSDQAMRMDRRQPISGKKLAGSALGAAALGVGTAAMTDPGSVGSYLGAGASGAALGMMFGPAGAAIGAGAGLLTNFITSNIQKEQAAKAERDAAFYKPTSDVMEVAKRFTNLGTYDPVGFSRNLQSIDISGQELNLENVRSVKPFKGGMRDLTAAIQKNYGQVQLPKEQLAQIQRHARNRTAHLKPNDHPGYKGMFQGGKSWDKYNARYQEEYNSALQASQREQAEAGMKFFMESLETMRKGGDTAGVMGSYHMLAKQGFRGSADALLKSLKNNEHAKSEIEALENQAAIEGKTLEDFFRQQVNKHNTAYMDRQADAQTGIKGLSAYNRATISPSDAGDLEMERFNSEYISGVNKITGALLGYGAAYNKAAVISADSGKVVDFNLKKFADRQKETVAGARKFQESMFDLSVGGVLSPEQLNEIVAMGPDGAIIVEKLAEDMRKNGGKLSKEGMALVDSLQETINTRDLDFMSGTINFGQFKQQMEGFKAAFKDVSFDKLFENVSLEDKVSIGNSFQKLVEQSKSASDQIASNMAQALSNGNLKATDTAKLTNAFAQLGTEASKVYSQKLKDGAISVQDIVKKSKESSINLGELIQIDEGNKNKALDSIRNVLSEGAKFAGKFNEEVKSKISNLDLSSTVDDIRKAIGDKSFLDGVEGHVEIEALLTEEQYRGDLQRLLEYGKSLGIDMPVDIDPSMAKATAGAFKKIVQDDRLKSVLELETDVASDKLVDFHQDADRNIYTVQVDAETGEAEKVLNKYVLDHDGNLVKLDTDLSTAEAKKALDDFKRSANEQDLKPAIDLSDLQRQTADLKSELSSINHFDLNGVFGDTAKFDSAIGKAKELGVSLAELGKQHKIDVTTELNKAPAMSSFEDFQAWVQNSPLKAVAKDVETMQAMYAWTQFVQQLEQQGMVEIDADTGQATSDIQGLADAVNNINGKINVDADITQASFAVGTLQGLATQEALKTVSLGAASAFSEAGRLHGEASKGANKNVDANTGSADKKIDNTNRKAGQSKTKNVDANTSSADKKIAQTDAKAKKGQTKKVDADTGAANSKAATLHSALSKMARKLVNVTDNGTAQSVQNRINSIQGKTVSVAINTVKTVTEIVQKAAKKADGGVVDYYANGGVRENHVAQIAKAGTWRVWAEDETGGEAYIPLARSKRKRSEAILAEVADRFGYTLQDKEREYARYADGGHYQAQELKRTQRAMMAPVRSEAQPRVSISEVNFTNPSQQDQFREFSRQVHRIARGL